MAYITISRSALFHNLDIIAQRTGSIDKIALVLKDNAYGHGLETMAKLASEYGVKKAIVRSIKEASQVADYFDYVLILADTPDESRTAGEKCCFAINALEQIEQFPKGCRVELKVDTGMHRNGIAPSELRTAFEAIKTSGLQLEAVFTHQRSADTLSSEWFWQKKAFSDIKEESIRLAEEYGLAPLRFHSANSATLFRDVSCSEDMVRIGIATYGCLQMDRTLQQPELRPVLALWGERVTSRSLTRGQRVGYNGIYAAEEDEIVSTYDVGYAAGLLRAASDRYVTPEGVRLVGRVSMDNSSFLTKEESLLIFDNVNRLAESAGTIGYEVLVNLSPELERKIVK